jgi:hypothetical protein
MWLKIFKSKITWIIIGTLAAVLILYLVFRKNANTKTAPQDVPGNASLSPADLEKVRTISQDLYDEFNGISWNFLFRGSSPLDAMMLLSDSMFVAVYNDFNTNFASDGKTLRQWILGDWYWSTSYAHHSADLCIARMDRLQLS